MKIDPVVLDILDRGVQKVFKDRPEYRHAELGLFTEDEARPLDELVTMVAQYLALEAPQRPFNLAIFGAPGSGKSRLAKELPGMLSGAGKARLAQLVQINLTQISSAEELARALANAGTATSVPFVFFDEFDAAKDGAPWGWLSWFLAPMQDGEFRYASTTVAMKRAVFVFAGGTAPTFESFGQGDRAAFVAAKGPDFVSRLRGYVDIPGVNAEQHRSYRRASVLGYQLRKLEKSIHDNLRDALLHAGRYRHGARSMEALVELIPPGVRASLAQIRQRALVEMHVDRGPLDPNQIGGCIGLSASADDQRPELIGVWHTVSQALFRNGAQLAYGGNPMEQGLTAQLEAVVDDLPQPLVADGDVWIVTSWASEPSKSGGVQRLRRPAVSDDELPAGLDEVSRQRWRGALEMFRMRHQLALRSVAQFAIGGRLDHPITEETKRFPGVIEELMLALAMGHPVYIAGHFQGAARWAGDLLGLGRAWGGPRAGVAATPIQIPCDREPLFRPPPFTNLPLTRDDLTAFLSSHALGERGWPDNGLTHDQNRELFEAQSADRIAALVVQGLRTRFAESAPGR